MNHQLLYKKPKLFADPIQPDPVDVGDPENQLVLDSAAESAGESVGLSSAMAIALSFLEGGEFTFEALDSLIQGYADLDGDDEAVTEEEQEIYESFVEDVCDAFVKLGASKEEVTAFIEKEDDQKGEDLGSSLLPKLDELVMDDADLIASFASEESIAMDLVLDAAREKRIRGGKVVWVKKKLKRRKPLSAARRAALKKARRKAHSSAARMKRKKSQRLAKSMRL